MVKLPKLSEPTYKATSSKPLPPFDGRKPLIAGNWKMNLTHLEAIALVQKLAFSLDEDLFARAEVAVLPPFISLRSVQTLIDGDNLLIEYGAQDLSPNDSGAYTGDIGGPMLAKLGCRFVVVGHSERRQYHHEDGELVNAKVRAALRNGLVPIVCVGEPLEVRQSADHLSYTLAQLDGALSGVSVEPAALVLAYEPIWAVGTGEVATPQDAQEVCAALRARVAELQSAEVADGVRVLYGGSVKASNAGEILSQADVDGALVGGASLDAEEFSAICRTAASAGAPVRGSR